LELGFSGLKQDLVSTANELCPRTSSTEEGVIGARTHTEGLAWIQEYLVFKNQEVRDVKRHVGSLVQERAADKDKFEKEIGEKEKRIKELSEGHLAAVSSLKAEFEQQRAMIKKELEDVREELQANRDEHCFRERQFKKMQSRIEEYHQQIGTER
jgi:chromosome segregation ATPase